MPAFDKPIARIEIDRHFHLRLAELIREIAQPVASEALPPLLRALADDLDAVRAGNAPNDQTLARAPLLHDWTLVSAPDGVRLQGVVEDHPVLGTRPIITSPVWLLNAEQNWAHTLSRFYRLAAPAPIAEEGAVVRHRAN
jgi:hypothetical protein